MQGWGGGVFTVPEELGSVCVGCLLAHQTGMDFIDCSFGLCSVGPMSAAWNLEVLFLLLFYFLASKGGLASELPFRPQILLCRSSWSQKS